MSKNGLILLTPTSIAYTGTSATISANGSVSFSACSSLSLNGVFSADYDNYTVVIRHQGTTSNAYYARWRVSGSDSSGNDYTYQYLFASASTIGGARSTSQTSGRLSSHYPAPAGLVLYVYGPYLAQPTAHRTVTMESDSTVRILDYAGTHSLSNSYDGLTLFPDAGLTSGRVAVYGMRK
jgi:hypothetical protein